MLKSRQDRAGKEPAEKMVMATIEEARMVLPGIQALFGFQLIAAFNERFRQLPETDQTIHFIALLLVAVAIATIMTPAAYHRLVERGSMSEFFVQMASVIIAVAMVPLMIALCLEVYLLGRVILQSQAISIAIAGVLLMVFAGLWFGFPFAMRAAGHPRD